MTRKQAMNELSYIADEMPSMECADWIEAISMGIKALEQEPCGDAISREDALQALCKAVHKNDDTIPCLNQRVSCLWDKTKVQDYAEEILKLPPVTPAEKVGQWIPVSERLPDDHDWYVIVVKEKSTGYQYIPRIASHNHDNCWSIIDTEDADEDWLDDLECVAWMPLPLPYNASPTGAERSERE